MLGQLWTLPGRRASGDLPVMTFPSRASSLTSSLLVNLVLLTVNSFVRCAQEFCKPVSAADACICNHKRRVGEGKTLTALNLAWLLAQTDGVRALIIDSDLRQPCAT